MNCVWSATNCRAVSAVEGEVGAFDQVSEGGEVVFCCYSFQSSEAAAGEEFVVQFIQYGGVFDESLV